MATKNAAKKTARGRVQDRAKVAGGQKYEVSYEAKKTGRSAPAVKKAVKKVGNVRKKVEKRILPPFGDIPLGLPSESTVARVRKRCVDYAETRPEYNHATVATCVIGRRALTRGLFLDRRCFLVSYIRPRNRATCRPA